jgi:hypothetical protein
MELTQIVLGAVLCESVWETGKMTYQKGKLSGDRIGALLVGILVAMGSGLDVCAAVGIPMTVPFLGSILTGILLSRGANFVHDVLGAVQKGAAK